MLLEKEQIPTYKETISEIYQREFGEDTRGLIFFGLFSEDEIIAVASVRNYMGHWYLRGCYVEPEFRGNGLQRELIQERINYLKSRTNEVRVSVFPDNIHSIHNIEAEGFEFERIKKLETEESVLIYKKTF
jgi:RimJ/RimL family protein N-acetyltransferase